MDDITRILKRLECDPASSTRELIRLVYDELRAMAAVKMANERINHTLDATALVHEAFVRLVQSPASWNSRRHFFGAAAESMRRILIDQARSRLAEKRGGRMAQIDLELEQIVLPTDQSDRIIELSQAIERLAALSPQKAELVKLRYFAGLTIREAAELLSISTATADRHWAYARSWLQAEMADPS